MRKIFLLITFVLLFYSCGEKIRVEHFTKLNESYKKIEASIELGTSYVEYIALVKDFSKELLLLKDTKLNKPEIDLKSNFDSLLIIHKDCSLLWEYSIKYSVKTVILNKSSFLAVNNPNYNLDYFIKKYNLNIDSNSVPSENMILQKSGAYVRGFEPAIKVDESLQKIWLSCKKFDKNVLPE